MKKAYIFLAIIFQSALIFGQDSKVFLDGYTAEVGIGPVFTTDKTVPFWMRSMQYGSIPLSGISSSLTGSFKKDFLDREKLFEWGGKVEGRVNGGKDVNGLLIEGYLKARLSIFQIKAGRSRDVDGLADSTLSTGSFSISGNALGIPKVEVSIPEYQYVPYTSNLIAIKGNLSHGWMGRLPIQYGAYKGQELPTYFHHLSAYGRFGKEDWRLKLYAAVNHDVIWGSDKKIFGEQYDLSSVSAFLYVITGKAYKGAKDFKGESDISKIGNHQGSIDIGADYDFINMKVNFYHQFFYDKGALAYLANIADGLTGLSFVNKYQGDSRIFWKKILFEFFYSKDQAGQPGAKFTPSGPEYYYNHGVYASGFSYLGQSLGTSLFTPAYLAKPGQTNHVLNYFINNRVIAYHIGLISDVHEWEVMLKCTLSRNYGDYATSGPDEQWFNGKRKPQPFAYGKFTPVSQFSTFIQASKPLRNNLRMGFVLAGDYGQLFTNSLGGSFTLTKSW